MIISKITFSTTNNIQYFNNVAGLYSAFSFIVHIYYSAYLF